MSIDTGPARSIVPTWAGRAATLPVYVFAASTLVFIWFSGLVEVSYENPLMTMLVNTLLVTGVSAGGAWLAVNGYLASGLPELLYAGCGLVATGSCFLISSLVIGSAEGPNDAVTVHNLGIFLAALLHLVAAVRAGQPRSGREDPGAVKAVFACLGVLALIGLFWAAARYDLAPVFYVAGEGTTPVRQLVLTLATAFLAMAAAFLMSHAVRRGSLALRLYSLGLGLIAIGLIDVSIAVPGSILSWIGRLSQSFGHVYLLAAFTVAIRTAVRKGLDVNAAAADYFLESEDHYRALVNALRAAVISLDYKGRVVLWNLRAEILFGYGHGEAAGRLLTDLIVPEGGERKAFQDLLEERSGRYQELALRRKDGRGFPAEALVFGIGPGSAQWTNLVIRDISDRRQAENVLRESHLRYELVVAGAQGAIWDWDVVGQRVYFSPQWKALRGYAPDELSDSEVEWRSRIHPEDVARVLNAVQEHFEGRTPVFSEEYRVRCKDGSWKWIFDRGLALRDVAGRVVRMAGSETDITERKNAVEELRKRELRLRQALQVSRSFAFEWNPATDQVTRSVESGPLLGLHGDEAVHDTGRGFFQRVHPEDRERFVATLKTLTPDRPSYTTRYRLVRPDGSLVILEETGIGFFDAGQCLSLMTGISTDVTERETSRERVIHLASFPRLNPNPIAEMDLDGQVRFCNPSAQRLFPDLLQRGLEHPWLAGWDAVRRGVAVHGSYQFEREVTIGDRWYHQMLHFIPESRSVRIYGLDITELKSAEQRLRESQADLNWAQAVGRIGSWRLNVQRNELRWSEENHRIFGVPKGHPMSYETFLGIVHPDDRDYVHRKWSAGLRGEPYNIVHRIVVGDTVKWVRERAELEFDADGKLLGGFGITQDITEHKQADDALRASEARFRLLAETAAELLAASNPQDHIKVIAARVMNHLDCHCFFNFLVADGQPGRLQLNAWAGIPEQEARRIEWLDYGVAVSGCVARDGKRIVAEHIPTTADVRTELVKSYGIKAYACHPLAGVDGRMLGTLSFGTRSRETFSPEALTLMKAAADQVTVALLRMQNERDLQRSADALQEANERLEEMVRLRTLELEDTVSTLRNEILVRKKIQTQLHQLSRKSLEALEADRRTVSRELHDSIGGSLAAIKFGLEEWAERVQQDPACGAQSMGALISHLTDTIKETKRISANLRPLTIDDLGFLATIEWYTRQFCQRFGNIRVVCKIGVEEQDIPEEFKIVLYRVMQEALTNVARHSQADAVTIRLTKSATHFEFEVEDNGCGFDTSNVFGGPDRLSGYGLKSMQERAEICGGTLNLRTRPSAGTSVKVSLPFTAASPD